MTVSFDKLSILSALLVVLTGCSSISKIPFADRWNTQKSEVPSSATVQSAAEGCTPETGAPFHFRKVLLVAGTTGVSGIARDLPGLADLTSRRLQTHLDALNRFNVFATHNSSFETMASGTAVRVKQLGRDFASQFVVKLKLEDLTTYTAGGWLPELLGGITHRNVLLKMYIYDTEHGTLFYSKQYQDIASGDVVGYPGDGKVVSDPWFNTDLGIKIDSILKTISMQIDRKLACVPFSAEVVAVKGSDIHINAGYLHGVRPGETLRAYRSADVLASSGTQKQGENEGWIKVQTVFPNHSIASYNQDSLGDIVLDTGDIIRAW